MSRARRPAPFLVSALVLAAAFCASCGSNPAQPTGTPSSTTWTDLAHFEEIVGTNWTGTATFTASDGAKTTSAVSICFIWGGVCDIRDNDGYVWCAYGSSPFGWGTTDGLATRIRGYPKTFGPDYVRSLDIGENPILGSGNWDTARVSGDRRRLVIVSSDFSWSDRRGVTFDLTRAPWPSDVLCPSFRSCTSQ